MSQNYKALVVVLLIAAAAFWLLRPLCLACMSPQTFARRRAVWFTLTIVGFLSPWFWLYALVAIALLYWASKKDGNALGLYLMIAFAVPNARYYIPTPLIGQLFDLTQYRILALVVLVPWIVRSLPRWRSAGLPVWTLVDTAMLGFLSIYIVTNIPYESATSTMRRAFTMTIDQFVVLYAFARLESREKVVDAMAGFTFATFVMAGVAIFERAKGWLLYTGLTATWGDVNAFSWLFRAEGLRAQAAAEHSINLGFHLALGIGFLLYLRSKLVDRKMIDWTILLVFAAGLYATASRGPWLTAFIAALTFTLIRPHAARRIFGVLVGGALVFGLMYVSPLRETVIDRLPIIGNTDQDTVDYRRQLAAVSWQLIDRNPFFGDPLVTRYMESMRQGQGIIDLVNGYLMTLLFAGWVGMALQGFILASALGRAGLAMMRRRLTDADDGAFGAALVACFVAMLFYAGTAGFGATTTMLTGLLISYASVMARRSAAPAASPVLATGAVSPPGRPSFVKRSFG